MIPLFDLHCDTLLELYNNQESIESNSLHVSFDKCVGISPYVQIGAIWSCKHLSDEDAFINYKCAVNYLKGINIPFSKSISKLRDKSFILAIEDGRLLASKLERLDELYKDGVRVFGLNWNDDNILGGGWNTASPLTAFGENTIIRCCELGIIVDVSHSNEATASKAIDLCFKHRGFCIASHSNSLTIYNHKRNISDELFKKLVNCGGIVGISLVPEHLTCNSASVDDILNHIEHFLKLGGEKGIALGCDFDGTTRLPKEFNSIKDLPTLYEKIKNSFGRSIAENIFFYNAYNLMRKALYH